jgi:hypothetical protein
VKKLFAKRIDKNGKLFDYVKTLIKYDEGYPSSPLDTINETDFDAAFGLGDDGDLGSDAAVYGGNALAPKSVISARPAFRAVYDGVLSVITGLRGEILTIADNLEANLVQTNSVYAAIVKAVKQKGLVLPPSGAMAGIYAKVDSERGVWKAPANVSVTMVSGPAVKITSKEQEDLNVDVVAGKSVNAIRSFAGKGTLVWGARTLAGNDNEWRYIPVRRFFNMVEESVKKSTYWAVFEPNDANLWVKVKGMIDNYLMLKWREGALQGAKPDDAFFVNIGLGKTMTAQDILEGRLIVEIGMAVVRPAEFIILRFMHKMVRS